MAKIDKFRGCLIGGAAGDALGYTVEFAHESQIFERYGTSGITEYETRNWKALISDDTQMTMFTAVGLPIVGGDPVDNITTQYRDWYKTQNFKFGEVERGHSWLMTIPELYSRRAPGVTCLTAIENGACGTIEHPINNSKGCGGVMRVAPIGLYYSDSETSIQESSMIAARAAAITHGHELGYIPAATLAAIVRALIENEEYSVKVAVMYSLGVTEEIFGKAKYTKDLIDLVLLAVALAESDESDLDAIHRLGEGWVAEETLAIAVFCAVRYQDNFENAIIAAVNHNGDSDSTGAVTGNILGTYLGYEAIPDKFKYSLELNNEIMKVADDLYDARK